MYMLEINISQPNYYLFVIYLKVRDKHFCTKLLLFAWLCAQMLEVNIS